MTLPRPIDWFTAPGAVPVSAGTHLEFLEATEAEHINTLARLEAVAISAKVQRVRIFGDAAVAPLPPVWFVRAASEAAAGDFAVRSTDRELPDEAGTDALNGGWWMPEGGRGYAAGFDVLADAESVAFPAHYTVFTVTGDAASGDGPMIYTREGGIEEEAGHVETADGAWWRPVTYAESGGGSTFASNVLISKAGPILRLTDTSSGETFAIVNGTGGVPRFWLPDDAYLLLEGSDGSGKITGIKGEFAAGDFWFLHEGNAPLTKYFRSSAITPIAAGGTYSASHGFGVVPTLYHLLGICITAGNGISIGDEIRLGPAMVDANAAHGFTMRATSTAIMAAVGNVGIALISPSTKAQIALTEANFDWYLEAFA